MCKKLLLLLLALSFLISNSVLANQEPENSDFFEILKSVYQTHPGLNAAREQLKETKELYPQARAGWLPTIDASAQIYATDIDNSNFGNGDGATTKNLNLSLDQPIWRGGQTFAETDRAKDLIMAGEANLHEREQDILLQAVIAMLNLNRDRELYNLRLKNVDNLNKERTAAQERFDNGVLTITDVEQAKARLASAKANLVNAERSLEISEAEYKAVIGQEPPKQMNIPMIDFQFPDSIEDMKSMAESTNPTLWISRFQHDAAGHNADAVFRELFPQISAFASYDKQYDPQPGIVPDSRTETIGIRATIPLYAGGARHSRIREAKYAEQRRAYEAEDMQRQVIQDLIANYRAYLTVSQERALRENEIYANQQALKGVSEEANLGQRTVLDILDADRDLINARVALANAKRDETFAQFSVAAGLGILTAHNLGLSQDVAK